MFRTNTGKRIFNLTGSPIKMIARRSGSSFVIDSDGFAPSNRAGAWKKMKLDNSYAIEYYDVSRGYDYYNVDPVDGFIPDSGNDDWFAIVTDEYYMACLDMDLPTDRLYTVGKPLMNADGTIRGYGYLVKR